MYQPSAASSTDRTKKLIELPNDVCRRLAVHAAAKGTSVKKLIESLVISSLEDAEDEVMYAYLLHSCPAGSEMLAPEEQADFMADMRRKAAQAD